MLNREIAFADFLEKAGDDVYWFTEPDYRIFRKWPPLVADCALLFRERDTVPITPSWRMATKKAIPLFKAFREETKAVGEKFDWHCDSHSFTKLWKKMGSPESGTKTYLGVSIEFRIFGEYVKPQPKYGRNYAGKDMKRNLLDAEAR